MFGRERRGETKRSFPLLPLREVVVFPHAPMSLIVGRPRSVAALAAASNAGTREILLVAQRAGDRTDPGPEDLYDFGTIATIEQMLRLPDGNTRVLVEGRRRAKILRFVDNPDHFEVEVEIFEPTSASSPELTSLVRTVKATFERFTKLNRAVPPEMLLTVNALEDPDRLADTVVAALSFKLPERQEVLEIVDAGQRLDRVHRALQTEIEFLTVEKKLRGRARREQQNAQRDNWLSEQMKVIQKEMGDREGRGEIEELAEQLANKELTEAVRERAQKELRKLAQMNLMSAEATVVRNYLDWLLALPWIEKGQELPDVEQARRVLDEDHYGLGKVKQRIVEYLAVARLTERLRGPILCLVGPPGVGKTSLARSIARATGRPFVRIALGGVRDEAEIRGHRRTYIGAMPGKILHAMKRAGRVDPVMLLDEVDKMSSDFRGDPASALLEVLDPEQNAQFVDHYVDIDYDLSNVMFVCTANTLQGIPIPLQDRLEVIELSGYTDREKLGIATRYLVPKQREQHGLRTEQLTITDLGLLHMADAYTREAGVRELERQIAKLCRKVARHVVAKGPGTEVKLRKADVARLLGPPRFESGRREDEDLVGLVKGLAVSPWGGELLNIEVSTVPGKGVLLLTGRLGDWLKESAAAAFTYVRSRAEALHLEPDFHEKIDIHVHYPGNPLKTDGPSAGIAMAVAIVSALTGIPVRSDTAMTGEISLRGRVLPIGGLKEKVLAAHRGGITRVLVPEGNRKDLGDIPARIREQVAVTFVSHMDRVLKEALVGDHFVNVSVADDTRVVTSDVQSRRADTPPEPKQPGD